MKREAFGNIIFKIKNKTVKRILAFDAYGCDRGFEIEFTDGSKLEITPFVLEQTKEPRLDIIYTGE